MSIYDIAQQFRAGVLAHESQATARLTVSYLAAQKRIHARLTALTKEIQKSQAAGEPVSPGWLFQRDRYKALLAQIDLELKALAGQAAAATKKAQKTAWTMGAKAAEELVLAADSSLSFSRLPVGAAENLAGFLSDGSPLAAKFAGLPDAVKSRVQNVLTTGLISGTGIERIVAAVNAIHAEALTNVMCTVRTETLRAYRTASMDSWRANSGIVKGWIWASAHQGRTCAICWGMDGTVHSLDEQFTDHPNGRCVALPVTLKKGKPYPEGWDSEEAFKKLPAADRRAILGKTRAHLLETGQITLRDLPTKFHDPVWGDGYRLRTLPALQVHIDAGYPNVGHASQNVLESIGSAEGALAAAQAEAAVLAAAQAAHDAAWAQINGELQALDAMASGDPLQLDSAAWRAKAAHIDVLTTAHSSVLGPDDLGYIRSAVWDAGKTLKGQLSGLTTKQLQKVCQANGVSYYPYATKGQLVEILSTLDAQKANDIQEALISKAHSTTAAYKAAKSGAKAAAEAQAAVQAAQQQLYLQLDNQVGDLYHLADPATLQEWKAAHDAARQAILAGADQLSTDQLAALSGFLKGSGDLIMTSLEQLPTGELKKLAQQAGVKNWFHASKPELVHLLTGLDSAKVSQIQAALETKIAQYAEAKKAASAAKKAAKQAQAAADSAAAAAGEAAVPAAAAVPGKVVGIPGPDYTAIDDAWDAIDPGAHFTMQGSASHLGGVHTKHFYRDPDGNLWMYKPASTPMQAYGEEAAYKVTRLLDGEAPECRVVTLNGKLGSIQRMKANVAAPIDFAGISMEAISAEEIAQIQQQHVIDWLISNHDGHNHNLIRLTNGRVIGIDRGQAYKWLGSDRLAIDYNPNPFDTLYNDLMAAARSRRVTLDPAHTLEMIRRAEQISDEALAAIVTRYADVRFRHDPAGLAQFVARAVQRKHTLRADFEALYAEVLGRPGFKFEAEAVKKAAKAASGVVPAGFVDDVQRLGAQGKTLRLDKSAIEDQNVLVWTERGQDGRPRTVLKLKVRQEFNDAVKTAVTPNTVSGMVRVGEQLPEDLFYDDILQGVKTVNHHISDRAFNVTRVESARKHRPALERLVSNADADVRRMAETYLEMIDQIEQRVAGRVTDALPQFNRFAATVARQPDRAGRGAFTASKSKIQLTKRRCVRGQMDVTADSEGFWGDLAGLNSENTTQYNLDFPDGVRVRYRPWEQVSGSGSGTPYSYGGDLEVFINGLPTEESLETAIEKLGALGIPNAAPTAADEELMYLTKLAYIRKDHTSAAWQTLVAQMDGQALDTEHRVERLREFMSSRLGVPDITKLPGYNPAGEELAGYLDRGVQGGWRAQYRPDISDADLNREMRNYALQHSVTDGDLAGTVESIVGNNGVLASNTEKLRLGVPVGGMSPMSDARTGGNLYCFTRIQSGTRRSRGLYFKKRCLRRMDAISYGNDQFGRVTDDNPTRLRASDITGWKSHAGRGSNETIFKHGLSLIDDIDTIVCSASERARIIQSYTNAGWGVLPDGRTIEQVVVTG